MQEVVCGYCNKPAELVTGREIYPHRSDLAGAKLWSCKPCDAYVGCHKGTDRPMGRLANKELRAAKIATHAVFDKLWRQCLMSRDEAYRWLAEALGIESKHCHIGMFDIETCERAKLLCIEMLDELK